MKDACFQDIENKSRILNVVGNKEKYESIFELETSHPTKYNIILEKIGIDFIESWFQIIVGQAMQSDFGYI
jgi:hypothetical protein